MRIAIAGYGMEGEANYAYYSKDPANDITIVDQKMQPDRPLPDGVKTILGPNAFSELSGFDLVVRTAGLSPDKLHTDGRIWSGTNEFFETCPAVIIGVTGTKGKGTTSSMITSIFEAAGRKVWLTGNIGQASISILGDITPNDIVVYELSSYQLRDAVKSPHVAVVLGIEPEHLDGHGTMEHYVQSKGNIRRFQNEGDICVYNRDNAYSTQIAALTDAGDVVPYSREPATEGGYIKDNMFYVGEHIICSTDEVALKGDHNKENACAAATVAHLMGISNDDIAAGLRNFKGLPHRLEYVRTVQGVQYYNDSFSSSTPATVAAVRAFTEPEIVIVGGIDRGGDFEHLATELKKQPNIKHIMLIGEIRHKLKALFDAQGLSATELDATTMHAIVHACSQSAESGDVVILSPGCASFDMFKDFYDRGDQFRTEVQAL